MGKKQNNNSKNKLSFQQWIEKTGRIITEILCVICCAVIPLWQRGSYYMLGEAKSGIFITSMIIFSFISAALLLLSLFSKLLTGKKEYGTKTSNQKLHIKMQSTDWFVIAFLMSSILAYCVSPYKYNAFWGFEGWRCGLFFQCSLCILYFLVSRFRPRAKLVFTATLIASMIVFIIGILHRFSINVLGVYTNFDGKKQMFLSTIGNANWFATYMMTIVGIEICWYYHETNKIKKVLACIVIMISAVSLVTQNSDSAYISITLIILILLWYSFNKTEYMKKFLEVGIIASTGIGVVGIFQRVFWAYAVVLDPISFGISKGIGIWIVLVLLIGIRVFIGVKEIKFNRDIVKKSIFVFVLCIFGLLTLYICLNSLGWLPDCLRSGGYFCLNDDWGNGRIYNLKLGWQVFCKESILHKIFGVGPDCFWPACETFFAGDYAMYRYNGSYLTNTHNEWATMLVNQGIPGFLTYAGIFVSSFRTLRKSDAIMESTSLALLLGVVGYIGVSFFCFQLVVSTPIVFIMMGMASSLLNKIKGINM